jgi:hypothetical protein
VSSYIQLTLYLDLSCNSLTLCVLVCVLSYVPRVRVVYCVGVSL